MSGEKLTFVLLDTHRGFKHPPVQGDPNVPYIAIRIYVEEFMEALQLEADWSSDPVVRRQNVMAAVKDALRALIESGDKEYFQYDYDTDSLARVNKHRLEATGDAGPAAASGGGIMSRIRDAFGG